MNKVQSIISEHFYKFFVCPHWIWYDVYGDKEKYHHIPAVVELLQSARTQQPEKLFSDRIFERIPEELMHDLDEAFNATLELMRQGKNIYRPVLLHEHWVGTPDFLEARPMHELGIYPGRPGRSKFGDYYYVAHDIRTDPEIKDEYKFPLVFASLILQELQGVLPSHAYIVNSDGAARSFLVDELLDRFHWTLGEIEKILAGEKPAPFLKSGCKRTPWYSVCTAETQGCSDVSLIYRLSQQDQLRFYELGIKTVAQLAEADIDKLYENLRDFPFDKLVRFQLQAQALMKNSMRILKKPEFPAAEKEIYFDIESDPTQGIDYLLGMLIVQGHANPRYQPFMARDSQQEAKIWGDFLKFLQGLKDGFIFYHYGYYERHVLNRLQRKYGAPYELIKKFKDHAFDLYNSINDSVVFPLYFYSLKDIAGYLGYKWASEDAGGAESVVWFNEWLKSGELKWQKKLLQYNEDDVRATYFLRRWLEDIKPAKERQREQW